MDENWVMVYSADKLYKVEYVKSILEQNDIYSVILNQKDTEFLIGDVQLFVDKKDEEKAKQLLANTHSK